MTSMDFISKLFTTYKGTKSAELIDEYRNYLCKFRESELEPFWEYFTEHYEYSSMPVIGKLERMRVEYTKEVGNIGQRSRHDKKAQVITEDTITDFPPQVQLDYADYFLKMSVPDSPRFVQMLGIIRKLNGEPAAATLEKRIRDAHQDHKNCRDYEYCRNGKRKEKAREAKTA